MRTSRPRCPKTRWPDVKARAQASYQAPSRAIARDLAEGLVKDYEAELPSAVACFLDDFDTFIAHMRLPITHRRATRTTNLLERLFLEEQRRLKIIPNAFGEKAVLKLMFAHVKGYDESKTLPYSVSQSCPTCPDGEQCLYLLRQNRSSIV